MSATMIDVHLKTREYRQERGVALLVVLFVIMAISILSLGFLSRSDTELACGRNMLLRAQMDQLADSALEHARGLILEPQDVPSDYWPGAAGQQLVADSDDYYDVSVTRDPSDRCTYQIACEAYRMKSAEKTGRSLLSAELRLDPCIALWTGADLVFRPRWSLQGDLYCADAVTNVGASNINGDAFSKLLTGPISGHHKMPTDLSLVWPPVTSTYVNPDYAEVSIGPGFVAEATYTPARVWRCSGDLVLGNNVAIDGMLLVDGSLSIAGNADRITAAKNLPALYVRGDLTVEEIDGFAVQGLAVVDGNVKVSAATSGVSVLGALFTRKTLLETACDSGGGNHDCVVCGAPVWQTTGGRNGGGALEFDGVDDRLDETLAGTYLNGLSAITISCWVKSDRVQEDHGILGAFDPLNAGRYPALEYSAAGVSGGASNCITAAISTNAGIARVESGSNAQTTNWQHLALVWKTGDKLQLYINGALVVPSYETGPLAGTLGNIQRLAFGLGASGRYWDGLIDDIRIYSVALNSGDIYPPRDGLSSLLAHWKLDESGSDVTITAEPAKSAIVVWATPETYWSPTAGAFFRSIRRQ